MGSKYYKTKKFRGAGQCVGKTCFTPPPPSQSPLLKDKLTVTALAMANQGFLQDSVQLGTTSKNIMQPLEIEKNRADYYSQPPEKLSTATLRRLCDELYLSMTPEQLEMRRGFLTEYKDFPEEISVPDSRFNNPWLGIGFYLFFGRGGEQYKPTNLFDNILPQALLEHYAEWAKKNERKFFENVFKALRRPIGGKKRNSKRTNRTNKRKTNKRKTNKRKKRKSNRRRT